MAQCADRDHQACRRLSRALGWSAGVGWGHCDACFSGAAPILTIAGRIARDVLATPAAPWPEEVALAVADRHGDLDEAAEWVIAAAGAYDRAFLGELMHTVLMRAARAGALAADLRWRRRFIERVERADLEAGDRPSIPRTRAAWLDHPACGTLIAARCQSCPSFAWVRTATGDTAPRCAKMGCPSTCRRRFLDPAAPCPRGFRRDGSAGPAPGRMIDA